MSHAIRPGFVGITPSVMRGLRDVLYRESGDRASELLQEIGFTSGDAFYDGYQQWLREVSEVETPEELDATYFGESLADFFEDLGWGRLAIDRMGPAVLVVDAIGWIENQPDLTGPVCPFTTGLLASLFGRIAGNVVAVMEVERPGGVSDVCRFLAGSPDTLQTVFDAMSQGHDYQAFLTESSAAV